MTSSNGLQPNPEHSEHEALITQAFRDLQRRAAAVPVNAGPHRADSTRHAGFPGPDRRLIPALVAAVLAVIAGFSIWRLLPSDTVETDTTDIATEDGQSDLGDPDQATGTSEEGDAESIRTVTGAPEEIYVLTETEAGTKGEFPSVLNTDTLLPAEAVDAVFDGVGGAVYVTENEVWAQNPSGERRRLTASSQQPRLVAARSVNDRPAVLVLVDQTLVGYRPDGSPVELDLNRFDAPVRRVAIFDSTVAAIVGDAESPDEADIEVRVDVWSLDDDSIITAVDTVPVATEDAPRELALGENGLVVVTNTEARLIDLSDGGAFDSIPLPVPYEEARGLGGREMTVDVSGDRLLLAMGEAALTIDLADGSQSVVPGVDGWVRAAHWVDSAPFGQPAPGDTADVEAGDRLRVDTEAVRADTDDPFLNVRAEADGGADLVAKLPPTYRGLRATGDQEATDDGADWIEVQLLHPVSYSGPDPEGENPTGWVNAAYTVALSEGIGVGLDEVPGCVPAADGDPSTGTLTGTAYVYGLESRFLSDDCLRVVLTFASGSTPFFWTEVPAGTGPASAIPRVLVTSSGGTGLTVDLGDVASAWPAATATDDGVYVTRDADGTLDLISSLPVRSVEATPLPDIGVVVIDLEVTGSAPTADRLVVLTDDPLVGAGSVTVSGLARPFEASLGVSIVDEQDREVEAVYSGSASLGTVRASEYGVQTNDWTEAWGRFSVTAEDLAPGDYVMLLDGEGGIDNPTPTRVPFTITDGPAGGTDDELPSSGEQAVAQALVQFARGGNLDPVPLADEVTLGLGLVTTKVVGAQELADRATWVIDQDVFAGYGGPFDLLEPVANGPVGFSRGPIDHCAAPPLEWPEEWASLSQISIEPVGIDSCIGWYGLSLFLNTDGEIEAVVLDLWEP